MVLLPGYFQGRCSWSVHPSFTTRLPYKLHHHYASLSRQYTINIHPPAIHSSGINSTCACIFQACPQKKQSYLPVTKVFCGQWGNAATFSLLSTIYYILHFVLLDLPREEEECQQAQEQSLKRGNSELGDSTAHRIHGESCQQMSTENTHYRLANPLSPQRISYKHTSAAPQLQLLINGVHRKCRL